TAAMLASAVQASGLRTGFYSSPHLTTHRERIRVNSAPISAAELAELIAGVQQLLQAYDPSALGAPTTYELGTLIAFQHFANQAVERAVVEVGLGGRLDATNVLEPDLSIFAPISFDHMAVLGDTLTAIATEKAGIIKERTPIVSAPQEDEALEVLRRIAAERHAPFRIAPPALEAAAPVRLRAGEPLPEVVGQQMTLPGCQSSQYVSAGQPAMLPLLGTHQLVNAGVAAAAARLWEIDDEAIAAGLAKVRWPGRLEIVSKRPLVVTDGAQNVASIEALVAALRRHFDFRRLRIIAGFSADKDIGGIARVLNGLPADVVLTRSQHPRAAEPADLARHFPGARLTRDLSGALATLPAADSPDLTVITGTLFLTGEARVAFGLVPPQDQDPL